MNHRWLPALLALLPAAAQQPLETGVYRTGAWFIPTDPAGRELYLKAGFNLVQSNAQIADWAVERGMTFIAAVGSSGLPVTAARPFEAHDGTQSMSVGLFTRINFNAPSVAEWWQTAVPEQVRRVPHADRVEYWKVHNEFGYHAAKFWDYSPGAIAKYRAWLAARYPSIAELNRRWGSDYASFEAIPAPRDPKRDRLADWLEWRRFCSWTFADYFKTTGDLIRQVVPGAQVSDNLYPTLPSQGWDMFELARQTDYIAYDIYAVRRWEQLVSSLDEGRCAAAAWGRPFTMMEYHAGPNHWAREVLKEDLWIEANLALARECRSIMWFNFRPGTGGREQGIHGILDSQARPTERLTAVRDVSEKTARLAPLLARAKVPARVAILTSADTGYLTHVTGRNPWSWNTTWRALGRLLDDARIPFEFIDTVWLEAHEPARYKAILVADLPVLSEACRQRLLDFAGAGGTVLLHPEVGQFDGYGRPRTGVRFAATERLVVADWLLPGTEAAAWRRTNGPVLQRLLRRAGVEPAVVVDNALDATTLDVGRLETGQGTLLCLTNLSGRALPPIEVRLPGVTATAGLVLRYGTAAVERLPVVGGRLLVRDLDPAAIVWLPTGWQPLVGVTAPRRMVAGSTYEVSVTVDNGGTVSAGGRIKLAVPAGWSVEPVERPLTVASGQRGEASFKVAPPATASLDRFALDNPLTATVEFTAGYAGTLSATATPYLVPPLDVFVRYRGELLNPWQELAPPLMRWGWENEVITPPPPPVSIGAPTPLELELLAEGAAGREVTWQVTGGTITPDRVTLTGDRQLVPVTVTLARPGPVTLTATVGANRSTAEFTAGVNTETVEARVAAARPEALYTLAAGARGGPARGTPASFAVDLTPEQVRGARVVDEENRPVAAAVTARKVTLAATIPADEVRLYRLLVAPATPPGAGAVRIQAGPAGDVIVTTHVYQVSFDTALGLVRWLQVGDGPRLAPERTGVVAIPAGGGEWAPDGARLATGLATAGTPVAAEVSFERPLGPGGELSVGETWTLEAERLALRITLRNAAPRTISLQRLDWELGLDPTAAPVWRWWRAGAPAQEGLLPAGFGAQGADTLFDFTDDHGRGLLLTLGRCALASKWQTGWRGVQHSAARTSVGLFGGIELDPGDYILAELDLWPHLTPLEPGAAVTPTLVTAARATGP